MFDQSKVNFFLATNYQMFRDIYLAFTIKILISISATPILCQNLQMRDNGRIIQSRTHTRTTSATHFEQIQLCTGRSHYENINIFEEKKIVQG